MKKYIKAQSYRRLQAENYPAWIAAIRKDIRTVARCENQEELDNCEILSWNPKSIKKIWEDIAKKQNIEDFDEKIDMIIDYLQSNLDYFKKENENYSSEVEKADRVIEEIERYLETSTNLYYDIQEDGIHVSPDDRSRDALIAFIDDMLADLGGRYYGTGRGGSWTSWNVLINGYSSWA